MSNPLPDPGVGPVHPVPTHHPDTLIAMATGFIKFTQIPGAARTNTELSIIPGLESRFILFLDALAALSVSASARQVVAVGMQFEQQAMTLTVAENGAVAKHLKTHLTDLLTRLKVLSDINYSLWESEELYFYTTAYTFSVAKVNKRSKVHAGWMREFEKSLGDPPPVQRVMEAKLRHVISALLNMNGILTDLLAMKVNHGGVWKNPLPKTLLEPRGPQDPVPPITKEQLAGIMKSMTVAALYAEELLQHTTALEWWAAELEPHVTHNGAQVPLRRALQKLTSHHRHIMNLLGFAATWEGVADLANVVVVEKPTETVDPMISYPSLLGMAEILHTYLPDVKGVPFDPIMDPARYHEELKKTRAGIEGVLLDENNTVTKTGIVHCEVALIAWYNPDQPPSPGNKPYAYIGVSKLSCAPCYSWIRAFNATRSSNYQTSGTHGRWYSKWAMPHAASVQTHQFQNKLNEIVGTQYRAHCKAQTGLVDIVLSDSSEAKGSLVERAMDMKEFRAIEAMALKTAKERIANNAIAPAIQ